MLKRLAIRAPYDFCLPTADFYDFVELGYRTMSAISLCSGHIFAGDRTMIWGIQAKLNRTAPVLTI